MTVSELIIELQDLEKVGMGDRIVVVETHSGDRTLFEVEKLGGVDVEPVEGSIRQRYVANRTSKVGAVIIQ